jgi:hypothetical protein
MVPLLDLSIVGFGICQTTYRAAALPFTRRIGQADLLWCIQSELSAEGSKPGGSLGDPLGDLAREKDMNCRYLPTRTTR